MKKFQTQHYPLLVLSVLAIFAAIAAYVFMYKDAVRKAGEEATVHAEVLAASKEAAQSQNLQMEYSETAADRALLPSFLVSTGDAVPFVNAVEAIGPATGANVSISSLSSNAGDNSSHEFVTATISANGSWNNVIMAMEMIENLPYAISIKNIHLNVLSDSSAKSSPNWAGTIDISVLSSS